MIVWWLSDFLFLKAYYLRIIECFPIKRKKPVRKSLEKTALMILNTQSAFNKLLSILTSFKLNLSLKEKQILLDNLTKLIRKEKITVYIM